MRLHKAAAIVFISSALLAGCTVAQPIEKTKKINSKVSLQSFSVENIQARVTSIEEGGHPYEGIQYDITSLVKELPVEQLNQLEFGLRYAGKTAEILGVNESGYMKGYTLVDSNSTSQKIVTNATVLRSPPLSKQDLSYLLSEDSLNDITIAVQDKEGNRIY
ncbi:hypothetical protein [Paenibacillus gorillae]|uniref:hypothetical protein n=1 Tax=Paenibacillus gorillae TaxID=1243662 RepID=UPI0004B13508|nr:hypothetical protein [Paenibacillus gorillae]